MTQALLNNLNNLYDGIYSADKSVLGDTNNHFDKIFEFQTAKKDNEQKSEINNQSNTVQNEEKIQNCDESITNDTNDLNFNKTKEDKKDSSKTSFDEIVMDAAAELVIEDAITAKKEEIIPDKLITEEESVTITKEEPTMQKQLALENPTMAEMLLSLKMHASNNLPSENEITESNSTVPNTKISVDLTEEASEEFKFDIKEELSLKDDKQWDDIFEQEMIDDLNIESITTDAASENAGQNSFLPNQSPQEQMAKIMIQGDISYDDIKAETISQTNIKTEINSDNILEQITKQMEGMYNTLKVNIVLNPQALGKVMLQILNSKEGLSAQFIVSNEDVKNILYKGLNSLKESLISQGINVDNITIKLNESEMYNNEAAEDWTEQEGSRGGYKEQNPKQQKRNGKLFEQTMFEINNKNT